MAAVLVQSFTAGVLLSVCIPLLWSLLRPLGRPDSGRFVP